MVLLTMDKMFNYFNIMGKEVKIGDIRRSIMSELEAENASQVEKMTDEQLAKAVLGINIKMDSLDIVEMSMQLERDFKIIVSEDVLQKWLSRSPDASVAAILRDCNA